MQTAAGRWLLAACLSLLTSQAVAIKSVDFPDKMRNKDWQDHWSAMLLCDNPVSRVVLSDVLKHAAGAFQPKAEFVLDGSAPP
jgi:hypothetical protein